MKTTIRRQSQKKLSNANINDQFITFPKIQNKRLLQSKMNIVKQKLATIQQSNKYLKIVKQNKNTTIPTITSKSAVKRSQSSIIQTNTNQVDITAQAYGIYNDKLQEIFESNVHQRRQIASLTKMMTMIVVLKLSDKFNVQMKNTYFRVSVNASNINGTIAQLDPKEWITVQDLLYGMMLPSGNDAAMTLAQNFGAFLFYQKQGQLKALSQLKSLDITNDTFNLKIYLQNFLKYMNQTAKQFQMNNTLFMNPHGLDCKQAYSTVKDLSILMSKIKENQTAMKIICTKNYFARIKILIGKKQITYRQVDWTNTHRLLWKNGFLGGKTGQTTGAGNCLSTIYEHEGKIYYILLLGCQTRQDRFTQTQKLINKIVLKNS